MAEPTLILFVEDDPAVRMGTTQALELAGYKVEAYGSAEQLLPRLAPGLPAVIVSDVKLPGIDGVELLKRALAIDPALPVILVTGHGDISMAVQAMRHGAYDFIEKPFAREELNEVVGRALEKRALSLEVESLRRRLDGYEAIEAKLIGRSSAMMRLRRLVLDLAPTDADILITGETGTGKELVARCLHDYGKRSAGQFAALNCGGMPETLFESEVFGHDAGAFTGAAKRRIGKIEHAAGGTLFLDEIESMPLALQVKLLRTLQERKFERLGSNDLLPMDCRVLAATKTDLLHAPKDRPFRTDLYYRLGVVVLDVPPLRERREDIPLLSWTFVKEFSHAMGKPIDEIADESMFALQEYHWPGNVRELRNVIERAMILSHDPKLCIKLGHTTLRPIAVRATAGSLDEAERAIILQAVEQCNWRIRGSNGAAALLDVKPTTLESRIKKLGLAPTR
jgi:DNA-binding NtrC family response regulator